MTGKEVAEWSAANKRLYIKYIASVQRSNQEIIKLSPEEFESYKNTIIRYDEKGNLKQLALAKPGD